jgi:amidase
MGSDWKKLAKDKAESVLNLIPKEWRIEKIPTKEEQKDVTGAFIHKYLSDEEIKITETDAVGIVAQTSSGKWKSVDVTKAFCHRAALAHQLLNCLHEIFFDDAIKAAEWLDKYYAEHKKPIGPLHGLPVSLKDQFHVKGVETHMGYVGWIGTFQGKKGTGKEKEFESEMVKELKSLGAVLFVKTSVPHTLMAGETVNNIIGYTENPKNRLLAAGGSSGGEGALIGLRGSPVGFGTVSTLDFPRLVSNPKNRNRTSEAPYGYHLLSTDFTASGLVS